MEQARLSSEQISEFYHSFFVKDQIDHFRKLVLSGKDIEGGIVVDIGGGVGHFASALENQVNLRTRVIDSDPVSIAACLNLGLAAEVGDALNISVHGDEKVVCFNLILHHLVASTAKGTRELQRRAIRPWQCRIFVNEYIYESFIGNLSGWLIYKITSSRVLSAIAKFASNYVPALRANTFGVGVRFRSHREWVDLFRSEGLVIEATEFGYDEPVSPLWRLLLIKTIRRDSFLLRPSASI